MGNKTKARSGETPSGDSIQTMGFKGYFFPVFFGPLAKDAIIVWRTRGFKLETGFIFLIVEPVQRLFILFGIDGGVNNVFAATCRNQ